MIIKIFRFRGKKFIIYVVGYFCYSYIKFIFLNRKLYFSLNNVYLCDFVFLGIL